MLTRRPIIIAGMARSGTTFLSKLLHNSGIPMWDWEITHGEDGDLWGWNSVEMIANKPNENTLPFTYVPSPPFIERLRWYRGMREERCSLPLWGFKEPRIIRFLQAYIEVFPDALYIFCLRNHLSTIWSQAGRKAIEGPCGEPVLIPLSMRVAHAGFLSVMHKLDTFWFNYDAEPAAEFAALEAKLGIPLPSHTEFRWKQAGRGLDYHPSDDSPTFDVTRPTDAIALNMAT